MILFAMIPQITYALRFILVDYQFVEKNQLNTLLNGLYNVNVLIELICLYLYFSSQAKENILRWFKILYSGGLISGLIFIFWHGGIGDDFLSKWLVINNLIYCGSILFILLKMYSGSESLQTEPSFFIFNIALFLYTSGTVIYFSLHSKVTDLRTIHDYLNISLYTLFAIGFVREWLYQRNKSG
jgi:hypothetical protein